MKDVGQSMEVPDCSIVNLEHLIIMLDHLCLLVLVVHSVHRQGLKESTLLNSVHRLIKETYIYIYIDI